jgi:hypothetical protein
MGSVWRRNSSCTSTRCDGCVQVTVASGLAHACPQACACASVLSESMWGVTRACASDRCLSHPVPSLLSLSCSRVCAFPPSLPSLSSLPRVLVRAHSLPHCPVLFLCGSAPSSPVARRIRPLSPAHDGPALRTCQFSCVSRCLAVDDPEVDGFFVQQGGLGAAPGDAGDGVEACGGRQDKRVACRGSGLLKFIRCAWWLLHVHTHTLARAHTRMHMHMHTWILDTGYACMHAWIHGGDRYTSWRAVGLPHGFPGGRAPRAWRRERLAAPCCYQRCSLSP